MTVGVICALPQELAHLRGALGLESTVEVADLRFDVGSLDGHRVVLVGSGMGKVNAAIVTTLLVEKFGCHTIVFSGVAGGLDPELHIGDVVIAQRVLQHDAGLIEDDELQVYQPGHVAFINPTDELGYDADPELLGRVRDRLDGVELPPLSAAGGGQDRPPRLVFGTILSGDQYLHSDTTRARLHREFDGRAIEMEGGAVAQASAVFGVPWLIIRALSDLAGHDSAVDFTAFADGVAAISADIVRRLLPIL